jgi:bacterial type II secretion system protein
MFKMIYRQLLTEITWKNEWNINFISKKELKDRDRKEIFYLLYSFSSRNIPLLRTLTILKNEFPKENRLSQVKEDIVQGVSLSYSLKNRGIGDEFVFATIHIGEETGNIVDALENVYKYYQNREMMKEELLKISIYPIIVLCNILLLFLFTFNNVFPSLLEIYTDSNIPLPSSLKYFNIVYDIQKNHKASLWVLCMWIVYGMMKFSETNYWHDYYGKIQFQLPFIRKIKRLFFQKDFLWRISCMLDGGIAIKDCLKIIEKTENNNYLKKVFSKMIYLIEHGKSIADTISEYPNLFSINDISYIRQGEESGGLHENIHALCFLYKRDSEKMISKISAYGQPIMILCLGLLVGIVAFSIIPLMNVTEVYM